MRKTSTRAFSALLLGAALVLTIPPTVAHAQEGPSAADLAQARPLLNEGFKLREKGDLAGALEKFKAAHSLAPTPITGAELGRAYAALGKLVEAREAFLSVARIPHRSLETERSAAARTESAQSAEQLRLRIPSITIKVVGLPRSEVSVAVDGAPLPADALDSPRYLDPGSHVATGIAGAQRAESKFEISEGQAREVVLRLKSVPPTVATPAEAQASVVATPEPFTAHPPERTGSGQRVVGLVVGGAGVAAVVVGGVLGLVAKSQDTHAASENFPAKHDDSLAASHLADVATIVVGAGAGVAVIGALLWFTAPRAQVAVGTSGSGVWLRGSF